MSCSDRNSPHRGGATRIARRRFLRNGALGIAGLASFRISAGAREDSPGPAFDREVTAFMEARKVPGGALAVVKDARLVYAQGYGLADRENREMVRPGSLFRIASISKPITAVAVLKLVEAGRLSLAARVLDFVDVPSATGPAADQRWSKITVRHLLQHTGGWDRDKSFDPMFRSRQIAEELEAPGPARPIDIIRYMLGRPLDFEPGERYAYSNFGYCLLGRIIERVSGIGYEPWVKQSVLAPLGITRMRMGRSLESERSRGEVRYYTSDDAPAESVFASSPGKVPWPYGGFCLEAMDAHGGWIASAVDLARFAAALHDPVRSLLLGPSVIQSMYEPPPAPAWRDTEGRLRDHYYGCGWFVRPVGKDGQFNCWHTGSLPGTATLLVRRGDGLSWAVLFNQRSADKALPDSAIDAALHRAANPVTQWPREDLFPLYFKDPA